MLSRRITRVRPSQAVALVTRPMAVVRTRYASTAAERAALLDPDMNGGYENPPPVKRQFRDPHGDWWDKQERRNYGEPLHEDNDILGMFSPEEYTHTTPGKGLFQIGCFIASVLALMGVVYTVYPDKQSYPKEYEGGLEKELGGPKAVRARAPGDDY